MNHERVVPSTPALAYHQPALTRGEILSFSAGSLGADCGKFRIVRPLARIAAVVEIFPELGFLHGPRSPLVVSCYPASLGHWLDAVFVDTYLRPLNFTRAVELSLARDHPLLVIGQPLVLLEMFLRHLQRGCALPGKVAIAIGGYYMPASGEDALRRWLRDRGCEAHVLHGFGMAEVDFGVLLGMERADDRWVVYRRASASAYPKVVDGHLSLCVQRDDRIVELDTGDNARPEAAGLAVISSAKRLHPAVRSELESWGDQDWKRKTGYVKMENGLRRVQLRQGVKPLGQDELGFHEFCEYTPMAWFEKPQWAQDFETAHKTLREHQSRGA